MEPRPPPGKMPASPGLLRAGAHADTHPLFDYRGEFDETIPIDPRRSSSMVREQPEKKEGPAGTTTQPAATNVRRRNGQQRRMLFQAINYSRSGGHDPERCSES